MPTVTLKLVLWILETVLYLIYVLSPYAAFILTIVFGYLYFEPDPILELLIFCVIAPFAGLLMVLVISIFVRYPLLKILVFIRQLSNSLERY